jgi:hypothetical protein
MTPANVREHALGNRILRLTFLETTDAGVAAAQDMNGTKGGDEKETDLKERIEIVRVFSVG